jgi:hypothetical protein
VDGVDESSDLVECRRVRCTQSLRVHVEEQLARGARLQPLLNSYFTAGCTWNEAGVSREQVIARNELIGLSSPRLWTYARELIEDAVRQGFLPPADTDPR